MQAMLCGGVDGPLCLKMPPTEEDKSAIKRCWEFNGNKTQNQDHYCIRIFSFINTYSFLSNSNSSDEGNHLCKKPSL